MSIWNEEEDGMGFAGLVEPRIYSSETNDYADAKVAEGERLAQEADALQMNAYAEGRKDERESLELTLTDEQILSIWSRMPKHHSIVDFARSIIAATRKT